MSFDPANLRLQFLQHGLRTAAELAQTAKVSQPTISRALAGFSDFLIRVGRGRSVRYGMAAAIGELGSEWPLFLIGPDGNPEQLGTLHSLLGRRYWLERTSSRWSSFFTDQFPDNLFGDLPWFLDDYRPQGFLGRAFARKHAGSLKQNLNPADWDGAVVMEAMLRYGGDFQGAFVLGREALASALAAQAPLLKEGTREKAYPKLAEQALKGELIGSSAGGEQPKFLVEIGGRVRPRHLLVKFSPKVDDPLGQRWADLLFAEHTAGAVLSSHGYTAARSEVVDAGGRRFLEVERFDRTKRGGREPVISLRAIGAAVLDLVAVPWPAMAEALRQGDWLTDPDAKALASLWRFGQFIANTDMHDGNASLIFTPEKPVKLAPVYDMLPMGYRPSAQGEIPDFNPRLIVPASDTSALEREMAKSFWGALENSSQVSPVFRKIAARHGTALRRG